MIPAAATLDEIATVPALLAYWTAQDRTAMAARFHEQAMTYGDLSEAVETLSSALIAAGIKHGDRVAVLVPPSIDFYVSYLATVSVGAIWLGLNPKHTAEELAYVINDADPKLILFQSEIRGRAFSETINEIARSNELRPLVVEITGSGLVRSLADHISYPAAILQNAASPSDRTSVHPDDPALIVYTSGTTGDPKGALIPHRGLTRCSLIQAELLGLERPIALNNLPINHIGCVGDITTYILAGGGCVVFQEQFDPEGGLALIEKHRITAWLQVPTMFQLSFDRGRPEAYDLSSLKVIVWSGAPASRNLIERLRGLAPLIANLYGMTETVGSITYAIDEPLDIFEETVGSPPPAYCVRVGSAEDMPANDGEIGEIQVKGPMHMLGYWRRPKATAEAYTPTGWLKTGDLGRRRSDGRIELAGRLKEVFKSGGYNVYPREVERCLEDCDGVSMAVVVPVRDEMFFEVGHAFVLPKSNDAPNEQTVMDFCRSKLANYKVPKKVTIDPDLPMLPIGKLDRKALKKRAAEQQP